MKLNIEFKNYKLLKDKKATLDGCNVYLVQGANEQGKTSFINGLLTMLQAENKTKQPVTMGEKNGQIKLDIENKAGEKSSILFEFSDQKNKFTLISDNKLMTKVTDIRAFLNYQSLTADEFISWSNTAEGKRKQRDIVLGLLGQTAKEEFIELTNKEAVIYDERTDTNAEVKTLDAVTLQRSYTITEEDEKQILEIDFYRTKKNSIDLEIEEANRANSTIEAVNNELNNIINSCERIDKMPITTLMPNRFLYDIRKLADQNKIIAPGVDILYSQSNTLSELIQRLSVLSDNQNRYKEQDNKLAQAKAKSESLTNKISEIRQAKKDLISNSNFPIKDLIIDDEGLMVKTMDGLLPFDINQVSTSRIMIIVAKIILMLNKHLPIIVMGRGEAFDTARLDELSKFADENDCMLIIDKVTNTAGIEIVGYENKIK